MRQIPGVRLMTDEEDPDSNSLESLFRPPPFESITALMAADTAGTLSDEDFARHLGWFLGRVLPYGAADCHGLPEGPGRRGPHRPRAPRH